MPVRGVSAPALSEAAVPDSRGRASWAGAASLLAVAAQKAGSCLLPVEPSSRAEATAPLADSSSKLSSAPPMAASMSMRSASASIAALVELAPPHDDAADEADVVAAAESASGRCGWPPLPAVGAVVPVLRGLAAARLDFAGARLAAGAGRARSARTGCRDALAPESLADAFVGCLGAAPGPAAPPSAALRLLARRGCRVAVEAMGSN